LNRVSFLRTDYAFLSSALTHETTKFLLFNDLNPLTKTPQELSYASYADVRSFLGSDPFSIAEPEVIKAYNSQSFFPQLVFLGLDTRDPSVVFKDRYKGTPFFALDITPRRHLADAAEELAQKFKAEGHKFAEGRVNLSLPAQDAAIFAEARHLLDWNSRNPFCAQCGQPTMSVNGGWKRTCPPTDLALLPGGAVVTTPETPAPDRQPCATRKGISNLSFPRTDPTVIMAVVSADGQKILLGRQKRWPKYMYSTLAGFLEPAESVEEAVRREVWEESGITLGRVVVHSTQPWPYPANLMIGAIGQATPDGETVYLGNDAELEDAKWWTLEEVREALKVGTSGIGPSDHPSGEWKEGNLRIPPSTAIANQLMAAVANGGFLSGVTKI
jgi:NAD+ diphosphatase